MIIFRLLRCAALFYFQAVTAIAGWMLELATEPDQNLFTRSDS